MAVVRRKFKPRVIDDVVMATAARLLEHGTPKAEVMRRLDLGLGTVYRIADGQRQTPAGREHERCGGCGGMQLANEPCRVCQTLKELQCD